MALADCTAAPLCAAPVRATRYWPPASWEGTCQVKLTDRAPGPLDTPVQSWLASTSPAESLMRAERRSTSACWLLGTMVKRTASSGAPTAVAGDNWSVTAPRTTPGVAVAGAPVALASDTDL